MKTKCAARYNEEVRNIELPQNESLLDGLRGQKIPVPFSCGGEGICTTCRIILIKGELSPPTELEAERAQERGYKANERLSCQCSPLSAHLEIKIP